KGALPLRFGGETRVVAVEAWIAGSRSPVVEIFFPTGEVGEIGGNRQLAASHRLGRDVLVVQRGIDDRLAALEEIIGSRILNVEVEGTQVEVVALAEARKIGFVAEHVVADAIQAVGL